MTTAQPLYLFTGYTHVQRERRDRYAGNSRAGHHDLPRVTVTVLATDQADAERTVAAMLSTPPDTDNGYSTFIDTHTRHFSWDRVEHAPAETGEAEQLRQELAHTVALLDEAQSAGRLAQQQADAERGAAEYAQDKIARVYALHVPAGSPAVCQHCNGSQGTHPAFPCETIRALAPEDDE